MFNSVSKFLWGGADNESDYTDQQVLQEGHQSLEEGENRVVALEHTQEDDWVLVANSGPSSTALPEAAEAVDNVETAADTAALNGRLDDTEEVVHRRRPEDAAHQRRTSLITALRAKDTAERKAVSIIKKSISKQKCQRQNKVREMNSSSKSSINHKNKQLRPSGFKTSRNSQRFVPKMA